MTMPTPGLDPRMDRLLEAVLTVASNLELESVLERIVEAACDLVEARYGALGVIDEEGRGLSAFVHHGFDPGTAAEIGHLPEGHGILGLLIEEPSPIRLDDLTEHPGAYGFPAGHPPMHSFVGVPILVREEVYGNLYLTEKRAEGGFTREDESLLIGLAAVAGTAIANARLYEEAQRRDRWHDAIAEVSAAVLDGEPSRAVRQRVAVQGAALVDADTACVIEPHAEGLWVLASVGDAPSEGFLVGAAEITAAEETLERGEPARTDHGPIFGSAAVWVPIRVAGEVVAAIGVGRDRPFSAPEVDLLASFASQVDVAWSFERAQADLQRLSLVADRERIGRDLHDTVIQRLFATGLSLQAAQRKVSGQPELFERLEGAVDDIDGIVKEIRATIFALQSSGDLDRGVRSQVLDLVEELSSFLPRAPRVRFDGPIDTIVGPTIRDHLLPVLRETLTNVAKHAAANDVEVEVAADHAGVRLRVADDGVGMPEEPGQGFGLANLHERAAQLGGTVWIGSTSTDGGTVVIWTVPGQ